MANVNDDVAEVTNTVDSHDIQSILSSEERDFLIRNNHDQIPVSNLVGKNILFYFSAQWCHPYRTFLPKLIEAYHKIKAKDDAFEVIFISSDGDKTSFDEFFSGMPWLALPFGDKSEEFLSRTFKVEGNPMLVAIGPTGRTITTTARDLIMAHGADAYPFNDERLKEIEAETEEMARGWPERIRHVLHEEHELVLTRHRAYSIYECDGCDEQGQEWSFHCEECRFHLHPNCALEEANGSKDDAKEEEPKEGWIWDGEVCFKA